MEASVAKYKDAAGRNYSVLYVLSENATERSEMPLWVTSSQTPHRAGFRAGGHVLARFGRYLGERGFFGHFPDGSAGSSRRCL